MGLIDVLLGKQKLFKPSTRTLQNIEQEFTRLLNSPPKPAQYIVQDPLKPTYNTLASAVDRAEVQRAGDDIRSSFILFIPVQAVPANNVAVFDQDVDADGFAILARIGGGDRKEIESSDTARLYVEFNRDGVLWPFSFNILAQGAQKSDLSSINRKIAHIRIFVQNASTDPESQPFMVCALLRAMSFSSVAGGAGSFGAPMSSSASGGDVSSPTYGQGSSSQPAPTPAPSPSPSPSPAPIPRGKFSGDL